MASSSIRTANTDADPRAASSPSSSPSVLPAPLLSFLSSYPHPTCTLLATPLYDALITRQSHGHAVPREPISISETAKTLSMTETLASSNQNSPRPASPALPFIPETSDDTLVGTTSSGSSSGPFMSSASVAGPAPLTHEDRVLASAFRGSNRAIHSHQNPNYIASTITSNSTSNDSSKKHASLLEGGQQLPHDPSRTAEGAVAAMYEQRKEAKDAKAANTSTSSARTIAPSPLSLTSQTISPSTTTPDSTAGPTSSMSSGSRSQHSAHIDKPSVLANDRWASKCIDQNGTGNKTRQEEGKGLGLHELLRPNWANSKWQEMMAVKESSTKDQEGLCLLSVTGRQEFQKILALLVEVLSDDPNVNPSSDHTTTIALRFPAHSKQYRKPLPAVPLSSPRLSHGDDRRSSIISVASSAGQSHSQPNNTYSVGTSSSNGSSVTDTNGTSRLDEPMLQIVASYIPSYDVIVFTTVATDVFVSSSSSLSIYDIAKATTPPASLSSAAPHPNPLETTLPPLSRSATVRPPLHSSLSLASVGSNVSSVGTVVPGGRRSTATTPSNTSPTPSPAAISSAPATPLLSPTEIEPLPTDQLPEPPKLIEPMYNFAQGAQLLDPRLPSFDPASFVVEKSVRRRRTTTRGSNNSKFKEMENDSEAISSARRRRQTIGGSDTTSDGNEEENNVIDEQLDSELDVLRQKSRTGSTTIREEEKEEERNDDDDGDSEEEMSGLDAKTPSVDVMTHRRLSLYNSGFRAFIEVISRTPCGRLIANHPWETTDLGPIATWDRELRSLTMLMLANPFRCALWMGDQATLLYNDEYARMLSTKHPRILGLGGAEGWSEVWDELGPLAARVMQGETVAFYDHMFPITCNGFLEETYHCWSYLPIRNPDGKVIGYENTSFETTARVIAERRLATMRDLVAVTQLARTTEEFCAKTLQVLALNEYDLPFAMLYTVEAMQTNAGKRTAGFGSDGSRTGTGTDSVSRSGTGGSGGFDSQTLPLKLTLQGTVGVPEGHPSAPPDIVVRIDPTRLSASTTTGSTHESEDTSSTASIPETTARTHTTTNTNSNTHNTTHTNSSRMSAEYPPTVWPFAECLQRRKPIFIKELAGRAKGFAQRGWPSIVKNAVVIPILTESGNDSTNTIPSAVLVVGLNPRRPWNEVFATFLSLLARNLANGMLAVSMAETDAQRNDELVKLDKAKTNFFSNVSHELRTPLSLILGPLDDILQNKANLRVEDRERLQVVQRHANRLLNMVNTLLDFSRIEGGRMEVTYRPTKLAAMTADLASLFRSAIERGGVKLIVNCHEDPEVGKRVYLAAELYEKVIFNLLGNAFKYTLSGSIEVRVTYSTDVAKVEIIDTGCGIEEKELSHIFERFHRVETTARSREGTGIGLALTLELVKALGASLTVTSKPEQGSTFTVVFPRGSAHLPSSQVAEGNEILSLPPRAQASLAIIEEAASWRVTSPSASSNGTSTMISNAQDRVSKASASTSSGQSSSDDPFLVTADLLNLKDSTVLLADDNHDLRHYIGSLLSKSFNVVQVADGQEALDYALKYPPSLIVTDVMMPRLDGNALLAALRNHPSTALIPVIFLSAQAGAEARVDALMSGADDYLVKPFQARELLARCNIHLQLGKMRKELERRVEERTRALVESEMRYRGLADRYSTLTLISPVGIFLTDVEGTLNYANPRWYEISGYKQEKPLAEWRDCIHPDDLAGVEKVWNEAISMKPSQMARRELVSHEFRFKARGNWVLWELRSFHEAGLRRGYVGSVTDISRSKEVERLHVQAVEQRAADAEENRRNTELFIDVSSHELRNPLSGVWQNAEVVASSLEKFMDLLDDLKDGEVPEPDVLEQLHDEMNENIEAVASIILCSSHQQRIADDILNVSKLNMGLLTIQPVSFDIGAKLYEVLKIFEVECSQKQIRLKIEKGSSIKELGADWIVADPGRISQIAINFLSNAVKFTQHSDARSRAITIHFDAYASAPPCPLGAMRLANAQAQATPPNTVWIVVGVRDSGKGLSREEMKKLFARFAQANPKSDQYGGSGLGLYVSRKLVELHKGYIEVESTVGRGSIFRFAIPSERTHAPVVTPPPPVRTNSLGVPKESQSKMLKNARQAEAVESKIAIDGDQPKRILVVEDNFINQKVMARQLKLAGYLVTIANNGQEALDILDTEAKGPSSDETPIAMILMDIEMPVMDGNTAIREIRRREIAKELPKRYPVVAVTGNARQAQIDLIRQSGFDDVALKPYKFQSVLAQIRELTDRPESP